MVKLPALAPPLMLQRLLPPSAGSASVSVRPLACPKPVLVKVTVKPAWPPAVTLLASAVLVTVTLGEFTTTVAEADWL